MPQAPFSRLMFLTELSLRLLVATCAHVAGHHQDTNDGILNSLAPRSVQTFNAAGTLDGIALSKIPAQPSVAEVIAAAVDRSTWTVECDSFQPGNECANAIDGNADTLWVTAFDPVNAPLPHTITIDMKDSFLVGNITIQPRQDGNNNGHIGQHTVSLRSVFFACLFSYISNLTNAQHRWCQLGLSSRGRHISG